MEESHEYQEQPEIREEKKLYLKAENLIVDRHREKMGEVVVRKEVETDIIEVPVRREKLVVEVADSDQPPLAEIDLSEKPLEDFDSDSTAENSTVTGEFYSLEAACDLLGAIALDSRHGCDRVRLELVLNDPRDRDIYQAMFDRCRRQK
ncbi:MAG: DUF2382 domain-containing protein [Limnospira sp.]